MAAHPNPTRVTSRPVLPSVSFSSRFIDVLRFEEFLGQPTQKRGGPREPRKGQTFYCFLSSFLNERLFSASSVMQVRHSSFFLQRRRPLCIVCPCVLSTPRWSSSRLRGLIFVCGLGPSAGKKLPFLNARSSLFEKPPPSYPTFPHRNTQDLFLHWTPDCST